MTKKLIIVDASALATSSCMLRFYNIVCEGYSSKLNNNDIEFGTAFHKFRASWRTHKDIVKALSIARNYYRDTEMIVKSNKLYLTDTFLQRVCLEYSTKYEKDTFEPIELEVNNKKEIMLELRFALPFYIDDEIEVLVAGTIDEVGKWRGGIYCICDAKTTSQWDIEKFFKKYYLDPQLLFYRWIFRKYAQTYPSSIYAKIENESEVGIFIDGIFYKGKDQEIIFRRSNVFRFSDDILKEFESLVTDKIMSLVNYLKFKQTPPREGIINGSCETKYDSCRFFHVCNAPDEESRKAILDFNFKKDFYNPLCHGE